MREWPVATDLLDPVIADVRPHRVNPVAFRARGGAGSYSDLELPVDDGTPPRKLAPQAGYTPRVICRMQAGMIARRAAAFRHLDHNADALPLEPS